MKSYVEYCQNCGLPFFAGRKDKRFCAGRCRAAFYRSGHPEPVEERQDFILHIDKENLSILQTLACQKDIQNFLNRVANAWLCKEKAAFGQNSE
jgi:hypothetical protein